MNEIIEQYISNVKKELHRLVPAEDYISDLRMNLEEYVCQFPNSTYSDLVEQFGTPEFLAKEFIDIEKPDNPKKRSKHRRRIFLLTILAACIIIILAWLVIDLAGAQIMHYDDTIYIYEEKEVPVE